MLSGALLCSIFLTQWTSTLYIHNPIHRAPYEFPDSSRTFGITGWTYSHHVLASVNVTNFDVMKSSYSTHDLDYLAQRCSSRQFHGPYRAETYLRSSWVRKTKTRWSIRFWIKVIEIVIFKNFESTVLVVRICRLINTILFYLQHIVRMSIS